MVKAKIAPKIAIITRTKDRPIFLRRAIESVRSQSFNDYIHVIINDGGEKDSLELLIKEYNDNRLHVIHNRVSNGLVKSLNQGVKAITSEYVAILDDDDSWPKDRLEKTISFLDMSGAAAAVVPMDIIYEELEGDEIKYLSQVQHPDSGDGEINLFKQCQRNYISNGIVTYRREVFNSLGGYDETLETAEDWDFGIRLLLKYDVELIRNSSPLFFYHQRPKQSGPAGNSVFAEVYQQERTINIIRNRYLRNDINAGKLGVGYIMNQLTHDANNVVRLEGHMNYVAKEIASDINKHFDRSVSEVRNSSSLRLLKNKILSFFKK